MDIVNNKSLKELNTFHLDVNTSSYTEAWTEEELFSALMESEGQHLVLGGGSNILFTSNFNGLVIKNCISGISVVWEDEDKVLVKAGAGVVWNDLVLFCVEKNFGGIENLVLIPGTVGASPIQNIGAYGVELKDVFHSLKGIHTSDYREEIFTREQCQFGYRDSIFKRELKGEFIITYVMLELNKKPVIKKNYGAITDNLLKKGIDHPSISDIANVISEIRRTKLPDPDIYGNAGSFFKNPIIEREHFLELSKRYPLIPNYPQPVDMVKIPAGWLIEQTGWKGRRIGNVGSHQSQALVLVNYGNATGDEVLSLASKIKESVKQTFDIELTEEVNII